MEEETAQHAEKDVGDENHVGRLSVGERDFGNEREADIESGREWDRVLSTAADPSRGGSE